MLDSRAQQPRVFSSLHSAVQSPWEKSPHAHRMAAAVPDMPHTPDSLEKGAYLFQAVIFLYEYN